VYSPLKRNGCGPGTRVGDRRGGKVGAFWNIVCEGAGREGGGGYFAHQLEEGGLLEDGYDGIYCHG